MSVSSLESIDPVISLCVRRALLFPNSEAYGVFAGFYDYGHYGVLLKRRVVDAWFERFVRGREDVLAMDASVVNPPSVWKASGHLEAFNDPLVECKKCKTRFRADHLVESELHESVDGLSSKVLQELISKHRLKCEKCSGELAEVNSFNLMFKTHVGADASEASSAYLRPETAQNIFVNFKTMALAGRKALPFGIAQYGKAFRNEISPRNFVFRCREFSQMELEYFLHPDKLDECNISEKLLGLKLNVCVEGKSFSASVKELVEKKIIGTKWHAYWIAEFWDWVSGLGIKEKNLRVRKHSKEELSHYSSETWDIEYNYPAWGFKELMGIADRGNFDLTQHAKHSKKDYSVFDEASKQKVVPRVIEPSIGLDRLVLTLVVDAFSEKKSEEGTKTVLSLSPRVSPILIDVFPLMKKDGLAEKAREVFELLRKDFACEYDESGSIGKRYARADEVGTPFCLTIDYDSLEKNDVTIRFRDSGKQERIKISELVEKMRDLLAG